MELVFKFDGSIINNPITWNETTIGLEYDSKNQITTVNHDVEHTWEGDAYSYLLDKYLNGNLCDFVSVEIIALLNPNVTLYNGYISIPECTFNETQRTVSVTIKDDSFGARVENNKGVKVSLDSTESKNGVAISASDNFYFMFTSSDGVYKGESNRGYSVHEAFRFLVSWMTDDIVTFRSDIFDVGGDGYNDWLFSGIDLRNVGESIAAPKFSFEELFDNMRVIRNLGMGFQVDSIGNPVLRIEPIEFFRSNTNEIELLDIKDTELSFDNSILYTSVKVGSEIIKPTDCDGGTCDASNNVSYFGFETEEYSLSGECVRAVELDLSIDNPFIIDTNKIQEVVEFGDDKFDDETFLIRVTQSPAQAEKSDPLNIGENWYNEQYTNKEILLRYQDYLTGSLSLFNLYTGLNLFLYEGNAGSATLLPSGTPTFTRYPTTAGTGIPLNDLIYDPYNRIDAGTERFTPVDEGAYKFCVGCAIDESLTSPSNITIGWYLQIDHYDSSNVLLQTVQSDLRDYLTGAPANFEEWESGYISMDSGDYCVFSASYAQVGDPGVVGQAQIFIGGSSPEKQYFRCCDSRVAVQDAQVNTGLKRNLAVTTLECPMDFETSQNFLSDTTQAIRVVSQDINRIGYIKSFNYNYVKGFAEIQILSNG